jgi:5-methyltetrahydropteroyltriglutamate--homocysteine methyltransferase
VPDRILTTHTGSLPRPADLVALLEARALGNAFDEELLQRRIAEEVRNVVRKQVDAGIDIVNDGETGKYSYAAYVKERLSGFSRTSSPRHIARSEEVDFPNFARRRAEAPVLMVPACEGPIAYAGHAAVEGDCNNLRDALRGQRVEGAFLSAASPGVIARFIPNRYYPDHRAYVMALSEAMKVEYDFIHHAGFTLQIDCPDLTGNRDVPGMPPGTDYMGLHLEALNHAVRDIPPEAMRMHLCWGNYAGPHNRDTPLRNIIERVYSARPAAISLEGANPRHGHEWVVFREFPLPPERRLIPGMLDSTTNFIEHPELVAQRIGNYASVVGRERVTAGVDCGFSTFATKVDVDPDIVWAKLASLAEGARIASAALW